MEKIIYYGLIEYFEETNTYIDPAKAKIVAIIGDNIHDHDKFTLDMQIEPISTILSVDYDWVLLCSEKYQEMKRLLLHMGVDDKKIMLSPQFAQSYDNDARRQETLDLNISLKHYTDFVAATMKSNSVRGFRHFSVTDIIAERKRPLIIENFIEAAGRNYIGYVRLATLQLLAEQVLINSIFGDMAELGVYRGDFATSMNELLPDRTLHLFDTFDGFNEADFIFEESTCFLNRRVQVGVFSDTSIEFVLSKMVNPDKCMVHEGYFPDSTSNLPNDIVYSLVSIDADIYKPIYEGLCYFYDRLAYGGYIMVHDYNQIGKWTGAKKAVDQFCGERKIFFVPIPDECGSIIINKPFRNSQ